MFRLSRSELLQSWLIKPSGVDWLEYRNQKAPPRVAKSAEKQTVFIASTNADAMS